MVDSRPSSHGHASITLELEGPDLTKLEQEAGGHRLQRIPPTERSGRVHTSTVTVAVLDPSQKQTIEIKDKDLRIEWFSGTGAGGQHRNKHQNSCRLVHLPSGITVTAQTRNRDSSLKQARDELVSKLRNLADQRQTIEVGEAKKRQVGSGQRGDKIRTIRFQDDRATDHRNDKKIRASEYMRGRMDALWD